MVKYSSGVKTQSEKRCLNNNNKKMFSASRKDFSGLLQHDEGMVTSIWNTGFVKMEKLRTHSKVEKMSESKLRDGLIEVVFDSLRRCLSFYF